MGVDDGLGRHPTDIADDHLLGRDGRAGTLVLDGAAFSIFGYFLLVRSLRRQRDPRKKLFLQILGVHPLLNFWVMLRIGHLLELRYFLMLQFVPLVLIGLMADYLEEKFPGKTRLALFCAIGILCAVNVYAVGKNLHSFLIKKGDVGIAVWGEQKGVGEFILAHTAPGEKVYFVLEPQNGNKFIRPLSYFVPGVEIPQLPNDPAPLPEPNVAYFSLILDTKLGTVFIRASSKKPRPSLSSKIRPPSAALK